MTSPTGSSQPPDAWHRQRPAALLTYTGALPRTADGVLERLDPQTVLWLPDVAARLQSGPYPLVSERDVAVVIAAAATDAHGRAVLVCGNESEGELGNRAYYPQPRGSWWREPDHAVVESLTAAVLQTHVERDDPERASPKDLDVQLHGLARPNLTTLDGHALEKFQSWFWPDEKRRPLAYYNLNPGVAQFEVGDWRERADMARTATRWLGWAAGAEVLVAGVSALNPGSGPVGLFATAAAATAAAVVARRNATEFSGELSTVNTGGPHRGEPDVDPAQSPNPTEDPWLTWHVLRGRLAARVHVAQSAVSPLAKLAAAELAAGVATLMYAPLGPPALLATATVAAGQSFAARGGARTAEQRTAMLNAAAGPTRRAPAAQRGTQPPDPPGSSSGPRWPNPTPEQPVRR